MPNGFPAFPQGQFPNDLPPTLFHPASPRVKPAKPASDVDTTSLASVSTFSSKVSLLKTKAKHAWPTSYKEYVARKDAEQYSKLDSSEKNQEKKKSLPKDTKTRRSYVYSPREAEARQRTAEAYMIWAATK